jgi:hypothetical protein
MTSKQLYKIWNLRRRILIQFFYTVGQAVASNHSLGEAVAESRQRAYCCCSISKPHSVVLQVGDPSTKVLHETMPLT